MSFQISNIDSYTTTATSLGAQYFTDSVQVLNNGTLVAPVTSTNTLSYSGGWLSATDSSAGYATYTIDSPGTIEIRLRNSFTGTIPSTARTNQWVRIGSVGCGTSAPALPNTAYRFRASQYYTRNCGATPRTLTAGNQTVVGTSPLGFTVVNVATTDGSGMSPTVNLRLDSLQYVIGFPTSNLDPARIANPFTFTNNTGVNWALSGAPVTRQMTMPNGTTTSFTIYTFDFVGTKAFTTVNNGTQPTPWPGSAFTANLATNTGTFTCDATNAYVWGGYQGQFTTSNGQVVLANTLPPQWNQLK